jgi:hypothetical protein
MFCPLTITILNFWNLPVGYRSDRHSPVARGIARKTISSARKCVGVHVGLHVSVCVHVCMCIPPSLVALLERLLALHKSVCVHVHVCVYSPIASGIARKTISSARKCVCMCMCVCVCVCT